MKSISRIPEYIMNHHACLQQAKIRLSRSTCAKLEALWQSQIEVHQEAIEQWKTQEETCQK